MTHPLEREEDTSFRVLRALERDPESSQRHLARQARVSLGAINYCLRALQEKGLIKIRNFRASDNKLRYAYVLTPQGVATRAALARRFLDRKLEEYAALQEEIETVRRELSEGEPP